MSRTASFFQLLIGVGRFGSDVVLVGPDIDEDAEFPTLTVLADVGFDTLSMVLTFQSSSGGVGIGAVSFNPQPEPPPLAALNSDSFGLDFTFTSFSDVSVDLKAFDSNGTALRLAPVPIPAGLPLMLSGLALFGALSLRRSQAN